MDEIDQAQARTEEFIGDALAAHRRKTSGATAASEVCIECSEPIPAARLAVQPNAERCVGCQNDFEIESRRQV